MAHTKPSVPTGTVSDCPVLLLIAVIPPIHATACIAGTAHASPSVGVRPTSQKSINSELSCLSIPDVFILQQPLTASEIPCSVKADGPAVTVNIAGWVILFQFAYLAIH